MKILIKISMIALIIFLTGCNSKKEIDYQKCYYTEIPSYLFELPKINKREVTTQTDTAIFMLDIFENYKKCISNLNSIKKIEYERQNTQKH